jgi:hypothetical protein
MCHSDLVRGILSFFLPSSSSAISLLKLGLLDHFQSTHEDALSDIVTREAAIYP